MKKNYMDKIWGRVYFYLLVKKGVTVECHLKWKFKTEKKPLCEDLG